MKNTPIIKVSHLVAKYGEHEVLSDISFEVYPSEIFMVIGGSGCGKTTLLNNILGLYEPYSGEIFIDGNNTLTTDEIQRRAILRKIGVLYQSGALFGSLNLRGNVQLPLEELTALPPEAIEEIAINKLKMVGLGDFTEHMPAEVSGGMQKRAALARAMALDPKILFLDEPSSGLDPVTASDLDGLIANLSKTLGITFIIVSHDLSSIFNIAQRVIMLHQGKILAEGLPKKLLQHENPLVRKFFAPSMANDKELG
jgi:phospholipid/cholesterol/gamma-HCH transport system ATP-binding protein